MDPRHQLADALGMPRSTPWATLLARVRRLAGVPPPMPTQEQLEANGQLRLDGGHRERT